MVLGTNELMVFLLKGMTTLNNVDLHGTGNNTQGDWVEPYPIVDNGTICKWSWVSYFPTIYSVDLSWSTSFVNWSADAIHQLYAAYSTTCPIANRKCRMMQIFNELNVCSQYKSCFLYLLEIACRVANMVQTPWHQLLLLCLLVVQLFNKQQ